MSDAGDTTDPWSREVPPTDAPSDFHFPTSEPPPPKQVAAPARAPEPVGPSTSEPTPPSPGPRRGVWVASACAVIGLLVAGAVFVRASDSDGDATAESATPTDVAPTTSAPPFERTTTAPPRTTAPRTTPLPTVAPEPPEWVDSSTTLPERLTAIDAPSAEVVVLTSGRKVVRITIGTGDVSTFDFDRWTSGGSLQLGETVMLISNGQGDGDGPTVLPYDGVPIEVAGQAQRGMDVIDRRMGPDRFLAYSWEYVEGGQRSIVIDADASVTEMEDEESSLWAQGYVDELGRRWISDAGGLYLQDGDGSARRFTTGDFLAQAGPLFLIRECDEQRRCGPMLIDAGTGERTSVEFPDGLSFQNQPIQVAALSPDGGSLLLAFWDDRDVKLLDLVSGQQVPADVRIGNEFESPVAWAPDSSGFFTIETGDLVFVDRSTGAQTEIPIDVDDNEAVVDVAVRMPG